MKKLLEKIGILLWLFKYRRKQLVNVICDTIIENLVIVAKIIIILVGIFDGFYLVVQ